MTVQVSGVHGGASPHDLGRQLEPAIAEACGGKVSDFHWFRVDWQRSGAATAYATYDSGDAPRDVVVKLPIGPTEHRYATALSGKDRHFVNVVGSGLELGGYDLAWIVMERLPGDPLAARLHKEVFVSLAEAAASFYKHSGEAFPIIEKPQRAPWATLVAKARGEVKENHIQNEQGWTNALREVSKHLDTIVERWRQRPIDTWCHGDLHPGNMMVRADDSPWGGGGCVLLDMAEVHAGNWVEDAVYLERLYWARPDAVKGIKPVAKIAKARKQLGLLVSDDSGELANIRRVLMAACVPAFLHREGHPSYLEGALNVLEKLLPVVAK